MNLKLIIQNLCLIKTRFLFQNYDFQTPWLFLNALRIIGGFIMGFLFIWEGAQLKASGADYDAQPFLIAGCLLPIFSGSLFKYQVLLWRDKFEICYHLV